MKQQTDFYTVGLAGQPNVGKSTIFNMLTGSRQHIANFPGVTVEKKEGRYGLNGKRFQVVDLPGTYSLTSYSLEERVSRDFILREKPDIILTTVDASNLERNLYLVFQVMEMERPSGLVLNMMDVARNRGIRIDPDKLEKELGIPVVETIGNKGRGSQELKQMIDDVVEGRSDLNRTRRIDYGEMLEPILETLEAEIGAVTNGRYDVPARWAAIKLLEKDEEIQKRFAKLDSSKDSGILSYVDKTIENFRRTHKKSPAKIIASKRYQAAADVIEASVNKEQEVSRTLTDKIDSLVLHRVAGPLILLGVLFSFYELTMNLGTRLADWFFPFLSRLKEPVDMLFGASPDLLRDNLLHSMVSQGVVTGVLSILYYVPIFLVLFALIAILEDSGYMTRVAFIMDRVLRGFGLHGQSTLPLILGGVIVGGCAVPGVMATRAMKDEKARLITILIMPLMNCLAKIPFYILIVGMFFAANQGLILFSISIFTFITALLVAKAFSRYLVKGESAPFVMELPAYHLPTVGGVLRRTIERTWLFIKKVITIILAVMVLVWFFVLFPGIGFEREAVYDTMMNTEIRNMVQTAGQGNRFSAYFENDSLVRLMEFSDRFKRSRSRNAGDKEALASLKKDFEAENRDFFLIVNGGKDTEGAKYGDAKKAANALKVFQKKLKKLKRERKKELIDSSYAAMVGKSLEPVTLWAGFNWKINVAVISTFAAKESLVGTLGMIYSVDNEEGNNLGKTMKSMESGWTVWHAISILILVALFPPCLATLIMIKTESNSYKWAIFAATYPIVLGFILAAIVFQFGIHLF